LSHYTTEPAAKALRKRHPASAAKLYRAMALRILTQGKSKYYAAALANLEKARELYAECDDDEAWTSLVATLRSEHHRKRGVMAGLDAIVVGESPQKPSESFEARLRRKWRSRT
jgi:uncharacterized Zn finger protein